VGLSIRPRFATSILAPRFHRDWVGFRANKIELGLTLLPAAFLVVNVHRRPDRNAYNTILAQMVVALDEDELTEALHLFQDRLCSFSFFSSSDWPTTVTYVVSKYAQTFRVRSRRSAASIRRISSPTVSLTFGPGGITVIRKRSWWYGWVYL
jgi:hypothetical protein